ncbi:MAG TPA: hypothetical protein VM597_24235 [Gemmataceae bacterium]|nr:hypothetical protein [Gemmataceae bacterium]
MGWLFAALARRVRAALLADAAGWLEARLHARAAGRRAWLHAEADRHEAAGRKDVAAELRRQAATLTADRPLAAVRAAVADLADDRPGAATGRMGMGPGPRPLPAPGTVARPGRRR